MPDFRETIPLGHKAYLFTFQKVICSGSQKFFVSVQLEKDQVTSFEIKETGGDWHLIQPVRPFILALEKTLVEIVKRHTGKRKCTSV